MSSILRTVSDVASEVRQQLDEANSDSIDTELDILPALNRAQDFAFDILARKYQEPILKYTELDLVNGTSEYDMPEDVFEDRVQKVEIKVPSGSSYSYVEVQRISYRDISNYQAGGTSSFPQYYCIYGRTIIIVGTPNGSYNARLWYLRNPEKLVLPQGRITIANTASNYVILDSAGSDLTTESDQLGSYVNLIDGQTGEIKGSLQIQSISSNRIGFRSTPTRSTVLNRTISGSLSSLEASQDDYLAPITGTCVPYFGRPTTNFCIQYAVSELTRKLGGSAEMEERILEKFEKQLERNWAGREQQLRVKKRARAWGIPARRWFES